MTAQFCQICILFKVNSENVPDFILSVNNNKKKKSKIFQYFERKALATGSESIICTCILIRGKAATSMASKTKISKYISENPRCL